MAEKMGGDLILYLYLYLSISTDMCAHNVRPPSNGIMSYLDPWGTKSTMSAKDTAMGVKKNRENKL